MEEFWFLRDSDGRIVARLIVLSTRTHVTRQIAPHAAENVARHVV